MTALPGKNVGLIFGCAFAGGFSIPVAWFSFRRVSVMGGINPPSWRYIWTFTLVCLASYVIVGFIVVGISFLRRAPYCWLVVALFGSLLLSVVYKFRLYSAVEDEIFSEMFIARVSDAFESTLWLSIFTLPISAATYYVARAAARKVMPEKQHWKGDGVVNPPRI